MLTIKYYFPEQVSDFIMALKPVM